MLNLPFIRETWLPALRSGSYQQVRNALRAERLGGGPGYCCLGVACDLLDASRWARRDGSWVYQLPGIPVGDGIPGQRRFFPETTAAVGLLPPDLARHIGILRNGQFDLVGNPDPALLPAVLVNARGEARLFESLANLNDEGASFAEIADVIEYVIDHPQHYRFTEPAEDTDAEIADAVAAAEAVVAAVPDLVVGD